MSRLAVLLLLAAGCVAHHQYPAPVGTNEWHDTPKDSAERCTEICTDIGLPLGAVVVMADNVGCVCNAAPPAGPTPTPTAAASGAPAGMATIMLQQEEEEARRRQSSGSGRVGIKHL